MEYVHGETYVLRKLQRILKYMYGVNTSVFEELILFWCFAKPLLYVQRGMRGNKR